MKIKLNQSGAGPQGQIPAGSIIDVDEPTGKYLIDSRQGVEVPESFRVAEAAPAATIETATTPEVSTATVPNRRRKVEPPKEG